jgi:hypothetical protein
LADTTRNLATVSSVIGLPPWHLGLRFSRLAEPVLFRATPDAGGHAFEGELAEDGTMEVELPPDTTNVSVELFRVDGDDPFVTYQFDVGHLDPISEIAGIQTRLANLGYYDGEIDGEIGDVTKGAIVRFRREYGLPLSEQVDDDLRNALAWVHDDDDTDDCEADHTIPEDSAVSEDVDHDAESEDEDETADAAAGDEESEGPDTDPVEWDDDDWDDEEDIDTNDDSDGEATP